jgi:hypothetical protein
MVQFCRGKYIFFSTFYRHNGMSSIKLNCGCQIIYGTRNVKARRPSACHEGLQGSEGIAPPILTLIFTQPRFTSCEKATCVHSS